MIRKELDPFEDTDKYALAGRKAEEKMAFYFKRFFASHPEIHVLNHIRLEANDDAAQIDHLIIHPFGMTIVESKSVHGKVQIKDDGQWIRWYGNQSKGMASPITQARLQAGFLKDVLNRAANPKGFFDNVPLEVRVAISDEGIILWPPTGKIAEVWKADQIADMISSTVDRASKDEKKPILTAGHIDKICGFLCASHKPLTFKVAETPQYSKEDQALTTEQPKSPANPNPNSYSSPSVCRHCKSDKLEIRFGHTYYFHCLNCEKNVPIKEICSSCNGPMKIRKQKREFFSECPACGTSSLYHVNPLLLVQ